MNEKEIERLVKLHGDSLGDSTKRVRQPHRIPWRRNVALGMASLAAFATIALTLWPRDVVAGTVARINKQILNASTFKEKISMESASGWHTALEIYYAGNMRRIDRSKESPILAQTIIERDGLQYWSFDARDFTIVSKRRRESGEAGTPEGFSVLDIAKHELGVGGSKTTDHTSSIREHEPVNGKGTYLLVTELPSSQTHVEILVEKDTDRPIRAEMQAINPRTNKLLRYKAEYEVNNPIAKSMFETPANRELVHLPEDSKELEKTWKKPIGVIEDMELRSANRMEDGTVWLAVTVKPSQDLANLPSAVFDDAGMEYARTMNLTPNPGVGDGIHLFDKDVVLCGFVPLNVRSHNSANITVNFANRENRIRHIPQEGEGSGLRSSAPFGYIERRLPSVL